MTQQVLPGVPLVTVEYSSNNSGGVWWLDDDDWRKLERAGWAVEWVRDRKDWTRGDGERWLGALATAASKKFPNEAAAIAEFEALTGQDASAEGCNCCGNPHNFYTRES